MKQIFYLLLITLLMSCSTTEEIFEDITAPDYVSSSKAKRLEVPPDLTELEQSESYSVPGEAKSYKEYLNREEGLSTSANGKNQKKIISNPDGLKIVKSGNLRWLVVEKDPDSIWPHVKDFWEELGFRVLVANKRTGIIETEWMDTDDIKLDSNAGALSTFDKWLDSLSGFADKRKFRTRVEFGEGNTTEIYISQRSAEAAADQHSRILSTRQSEYNVGTVYKIEEYKSDDSADSKQLDISESRKIDDYEIDSELLTRMMIKLGATDFDAEKKVNNPEIIVKSEWINNKTETYIKMFDPYDRSWRRLGLALDIIGFITEDKNRSEGIYFVRFSEVELPSNKDNNKEESIIDSLIFWDDDKKEQNKKEENNSEDNLYEEEEILEEGEESFTGIDTPKIRPLDEDFNEDEFENLASKDNDEEETWLTGLWPSWGSESEVKTLPDNERRYRIRIKPTDDNITIVYLDFPSGKRNNTNDARKILKILHEHLK